MKFINRKRVSLVVILLFAVVAPSFAGSANGWVKINGEWVKGVLFSKHKIFLQNGIATCQPPWSFVGENGELLGDFNEVGILEFSLNDPCNKIKLNADIELSDTDGLSIYSKEELAIKIYELNFGQEIFSGSNQKSFVVQRNKFKADTQYFLSFTDSNGNETTLLFTFFDNDVLIDSNH